MLLLHEWKSIRSGHLYSEIYKFPVADISMLSPIGLTLNFVGAVILLGSDVKVIENVLKKVDPLHYAYKKGYDYIIEESKDEDLMENNRALPFEGPIPANHWKVWPLKRFLERYAVQDIPRDAEIDIQGGWFKIDGEQLTFPEDRYVQLSEDERLHTGDTLSLRALRGLMYEARSRRIYIYGVGLLALGFLLQLIDSLNILAAVPL